MAEEDSTLIEAVELLSITEQENLADSLGVANVQQDAFKVSIYPNPSNGVYTVELPELQQGEKGMLQVYGLMGQVIQEHRSLHNVQNINITGAMPGYYFVRITVDDKVVVRTLIKK